MSTQTERNTSHERRGYYMKINIVIPSTLMGGGLRNIFQYANDWVEKGSNVVVYIPVLYEGIDRKINIRTSIGNTFIRKGKIEWFSCKFGVKKAIVKDAFIRNADVTIAVGPETARMVSRLNKKKGKKILFVQGHEVNETASNLEDIDRTYIYDNLHIVVITKYMRDYIYNLTGKEAEIIYNGVPEEEYIEEEKKKHIPKTIIMLANFATYKGGYHGLEIMKKLKKKYGVRCILYGIKNDSHIPQDFEFYQAPSRDKLMELYREADICLFPSVEEGWGLVATEAMANKCAVVGNNTGCLKEIGRHEENAMITYELNYEKMQEYVEQLINDDKMLKKIQENGYQTVKKMSRTKSFEQFEMYLRKLAEC